MGDTERNESFLQHPHLAGTVSPISKRMSLGHLVKRAKPPLARFSLKQAVQHRTFWHIFLMLLCSMSFCDFFKPQMKYYGTSKFDNDLFLTFVGILGFISSAGAKFGWGTIQDYLGFVKVYIITLVLQTAICFSIDSIAGNQVVFAIMVFLVFICEGAHFVIFPAVASMLYGSK